MKGLKGCLLCGEHHRANTKHSMEEVSEAVRKIKSKHPQALLTVEYLACVVDMVMIYENVKEDEETRWDEDIMMMVMMMI